MNTIKIIEKQKVVYGIIRDKPNNLPLNPPVNNNPPIVNYNADPITNSASFKYKSSIIGKTIDNDDNDANDNRKKSRNCSSAKTLKQFLGMPLINCEINFILTWSKNCVLTDMITHIAVPAQRDDPRRPAINAPINATFKIPDTKLHVPVVTHSNYNDNKLLEQLKTGFKRTLK